MGPVADAHPLGNFTVNHYDGAAVRRPDRVARGGHGRHRRDPDWQDKAATDTDGDGTICRTETDRHGRVECAALAAAVTATVNANPVRWRVAQSAATYPPGQPPLLTTRLTCALVASADLPQQGTGGVHRQLPGRPNRAGGRSPPAARACGWSPRQSLARASATSCAATPTTYSATPATNDRPTIDVTPGIGGITAASAPLTTRLNWLDHAWPQRPARSTSSPAAPNSPPSSGPPQHCWRCSRRLSRRAARSRQDGDGGLPRRPTRPDETPYSSVPP